MEPQAPGKPDRIRQHWLDTLLCERDGLVADAFRALDRAEQEIVRLRQELSLAGSGSLYRRVAGAGRGSIGRVEGLDAGPIFGAFDAIERCAILQREEQDDEAPNVPPWLAGEIKAALEGDSNDAEHDVLASTADWLGISYSTETCDECGCTRISEADPNEPGPWHFSHCSAHQEARA